MKYILNVIEIVQPWAEIFLFSLHGCQILILQVTKLSFKKMLTQVSDLCVYKFAKNISIKSLKIKYHVV